MACLCLCVLVYLFCSGLSLCLGLFVPFCPLVPLSLCFYICLFVSLCLGFFVFTVTGQAQAFSDLPHSIIHNEEQSCTLRTKRERSSVRRKTRRNSRCEILNLKNKCHPLLTSLRRSNCPWSIWAFWKVEPSACSSSPPLVLRRPLPPPWCSYP